MRVDQRICKHLWIYSHGPGLALLMLKTCCRVRCASIQYSVDCSFTTTSVVNLKFMPATTCCCADLICRIFAPAGRKSYAFEFWSSSSSEANLLELTGLKPPPLAVSWALAHRKLIEMRMIKNETINLKNICKSWKYYGFVANTCNTSRRDWSNHWLDELYL